MYSFKEFRAVHKTFGYNKMLSKSAYKQYQLDPEGFYFKEATESDKAGPPTTPPGSYSGVKGQTIYVESYKMIDTGLFVDFHTDLICPPVDTASTQKEEGFNPMNGYKTGYTNSMPTGDLTINLAPAASASVAGSKTDIQMQREHLLDRLNDIGVYYSPKYVELRKMFNMDVYNEPRSAADLIDKIKNGKYTLDEKKLALVADDIEYDDDDRYTGGVFYGITWEGPKKDVAGFDAALKALRAESEKVKDTIIIDTPENGLAALRALEAWTPTGAAN